MPLILILVGSMIPVVAAEVAKLLVGSAIEKEAKKRAWVVGFGTDLQPLIDKWIPGVAKPLENELIEGIEAALNEALDKIEGANSADTNSTVASGTETAPVTDAQGNPIPINPKA